MREIVLASASPRRKELLRQIGLEFTVFKPEIDENIDPALPLSEEIMRLAYEKALKTAEELSMQNEALIIAADTVVVLGESVLGKPANQREAREMLARLSGRCHEVLTGFAILDEKGVELYRGFERTDVFFHELSANEIECYAADGEPLDKAGAYAIQGKAAVFVRKIDGCYFNVMGLPLAHLYRVLKKIQRS